MIKAVVFDFDGLILDTETPEFESYQEMYLQEGCELTLDIWGQCVGTGPEAFNPYDDLEMRMGRTLDKAAARHRRKLDYEEKMRLADVRPGVRAYLQEAKDMGLRIGLASSSSRAWVTGYLERFGLLPWFECIRTSDDVTCVKPDPELYLKALKGLGVRPEEAVAFEDSPNGTLAAKRAGMRCVIVPNSVTAGLTFGEHDQRLNSMEQLGLRELIAKLA
ncbi:MULTISPECIES: HAD family hydrolase [unclassified Paenibacillus]|uniref:HAD family hydrolase n=1 Tax=unclassified Paenibacillus TaxID=185978 RepID=UPI001AE8D53F|nr:MULTISPECIES: HAD family hydrolase [unclassified Paenibacillus]MBP1155449.1 HAD superfamily hydrolase (TIGR01509 family) [Paenibacillus sp. PvP091]MBP1169166.1 HAD superfamily hydrolase (TIGR01509 family) [Paenibacillus sp. PvR098]MBP2440194.1 HAD superfamily hydrolase (TIGR01509 family) [Paenibacillus sp. PvP052]